MAGPDRHAPCPCGSGRRYKSCCYAKDRAHSDLCEVARAGHGLIDRTTQVVLQVIRERGEHTIACQAGCNACCMSYVRASPAEAELVADWLARPEQAVVRERFLARYGGWRERAYPDAAQLDAMLENTTGVPSGPEWEAFHEASLAYLRKENLCPFNHDGCCDVYPVRPSVCRSVYVVDTAEYCRPDRGRTPSTVRSPNLDEAITASSKGMAQAAIRCGRDPRKRALPEIIAEVLARRRG